MAQSLSEPRDQGIPASAQAQASRKPPLRLLVPLGILVIGAGIVTWYFTSRPVTDALQLSGRIEGYPTDVGARVAGRIESVAVREGDRVQKGQVIVQLNDEEIQAQLEGATARLQAAQQRQQQALLQVSLVDSQIQEARLGLAQSTGESAGRIAQAEANVAGAEAQLSQIEAQLTQARAELKLAQTNRDRLAQLVREGAIAQQQFDQAQTTLETAQANLRSREAAVRASQRQVNAVQGALTQAQTSGLNPEIRNAQITALQTQLDVARSQVTAAQAEVANAQATRQQILAQMAYLKVASPINGVVITRSVEPGTVVTSGKTLLTVLDPSSVYMRGYVPGGEIGKVRLGQSARVFLDSDPDRPLSAKVAAVDTQAAFTPENIYFREDRVRQVFGVNLSIQNPTGLAKPGMPADAEILNMPETQP